MKGKDSNGDPAEISATANPDGTVSVDADFSAGTLPVKVAVSFYDENGQRIGSMLEFVPPPMPTFAAPENAAKMMVGVRASGGAEIIGVFTR